MQNSCIRIIKIFFILFFLHLNVAYAAGVDSFVVGHIKIEGNQRISDGTLLNYLPIQQGDPVDQKQITYAVKQLYKTGFFTNVTLLRDGTTLIVRVKERPSIADVKFSGNSDISKKQIKAQLKDIGMVKGQIFNRSSLENLTTGLQEAYFSRGKYGVRIKTKVKKLDQNRVSIDIKISEGRAALIKQINIIGNKVFSERKLLDQFQLESSDEAIFSHDDQYSLPKLQADLETLRSYYMDRGYIKFNIDSSQVSITPDKKDIYITINVEEGKKYTISHVSLTGKMVIPKAELEKLITIKPGDVFSRKKIIDIQKAIQDRLGEVGYAFARVTIPNDVDDAKQQVSLDFNVEPGKKVYVRQINFHGNFRTHENVLRREMRLMEGSVLDSGKLQRSKIRLQRLSYIEDVKIKTTPVPGTDDQVDLDVTVKERMSGSFNIGAGYSQSQGFLFNVGLTQENLFGTGERLSINLNTDSANKVYDISFTNPYYTDDGISRTISLTYQDYNASRQYITNFQTSTASVGVNYGVPLSEYNTLRLGYGVRHVSLYLSSSPSTVVTSFVARHGDTFDSLTMDASFSHDTRNRTVFATRGSTQYLGLNLTAPGSDLTYYKLAYTNRFYFGLTRSLTLLLRSNLGYGNGYGSNGELPFYQRYYAGGLSTVRGYDTNSLGPRDPTGLTSDPIGGNMLATAGADLIFPIPFVDKAPRSVRLSAFYDVGNVFLSGYPTFDSTKKGFDSGQLRASAGISFVWLAPIGPLKFSWARALNNVPGDNLRTFQFSIGSFF